MSNNDAEFQQWIASDPELSVFVSASAGTGKTKILTDRFLRLMLSGVNPGNMLCITFTNAAASEMLKRIKQRLHTWSIINESALEQEIFFLTKKPVDKTINQRAAQLYDIFIRDLEKIKIITIHAFCMMILTKFPEYYNSNNLIIDKYNQQILFDKSLYQIFYLQKDQILIDNIKLLSNFFEHNSIIARIKIMVQNKIKFFNYLNQHDSILSLIKNIYKTHGAVFGQDYREIISEFVAQIVDTDMVNILQKNGEIIGKKLEYFLRQDLPYRKAYFYEYIKIFLKDDGTSKDRLVKKIFIQQYPDIFDLLIQEQNRVFAFFINYKNQLNAQINQAFVIIINEFLKHYNLLKKTHNYVEYDDLILKTIELFDKSQSIKQVLYYIDIAFEHLLIDEAQDINQLQWHLLETITGDFYSDESKHKTIFIVGDYKQSIYGFHDADPQIFNNVKNRYKKHVLSAKKKWIEIDMQASFRTTQPVLDVVNKIFINYRQDMLGGIGDLPDINHKACRKGNGYVALLPLIEKQKKNKNHGWQLPQLDNKKQYIETETAIQLVSFIKELLSSNRQLYGHNRKIEPMDIMILVRKRSKVVSSIISECKKNNIAIHNNDQLKVNNNLVIQDLLSLLKFILLPIDDMNLAGFLKSPIIGISEDELFKLAYNRETNLWNRVKESSKHYEYMAQLIEYARNHSIYDLLIKVVYNDNKIINFTNRMGGEAADIITSFIEYIINWQNHNSGSIQQLIYEIESTDINLQISNNNSNAIRIMTVHSAKGLQAPIVFIADSASSDQLPHDLILFDQNNIYFPIAISYNNTVINRVKSNLKNKANQENLRLLYVAMTRAEDELYLSGWSNSKIKDSWYNLIAKNLPNSNIVPNNIVANDIQFDEPNQYQINLHPIVEDNTVENIVASSAAEQENDAMQRGIAIHKMLQDLPQIAEKNWHDYIIMNYPQAEKKLINNVIKTINKYKYIFFAQQNYSELPVIGKVKNKIVSGVIDKMVIDGDDIYIIDFKTDHNIPDIIPINYQQQLCYYKELIKLKYPNKNIKTAILWLQIQKLQFSLEN